MDRHGRAFAVGQLVSALVGLVVTVGFVGAGNYNVAFGGFTVDLVYPFSGLFFALFVWSGLDLWMADTADAGAD